jgi:hypothetical protein
MLGWNIGVFRTMDSPEDPATVDSKEGARLAVWQTGKGGLRWIDELVQTGSAIDLGGNGYPNRYTARADHLIPRIVEGPPDAYTTWVHGVEDIIGPGWAGRTVIDTAAIAQCGPDEWLLVEAWDES